MVCVVSLIRSRNGVVNFCIEHWRMRRVGKRCRSTKVCLCVGAKKFVILVRSQKV